MNRQGVIRLNRANCLPVLLYFLIYISKDTFLFGTNSIYTMTLVPIFVMSLFVGFDFLMILQKRRSKREKKILLFGIPFVLIYIALCIYHEELLQVAVIKFLCITSAILLTLHFDFDEYADAFSKVMVFNSIAAILLELIVYLLPSLAAILPRMINTAGVEIINIGIAGIAAYELGSPMVRAFGVFWEPGVFQIYLNLAIIYELFRNHNINWKRVAVLIIGIIITYSTTGFIVLGFSFASYILLAKKEEQSKNVRIAFLGIVILAVFATVLFDTSSISQYVIGKIFGKLSDGSDGSTIARQASIVVNLDIFKDYPITGIGMKNIQDEYVRRSSLFFIRQSNHNTNTLLYQFAAHGLLYGSIFLFGTYRMTYCITRKKILQFAILTAICLLYVGENLKSSMLPYIMMSFGFGSLARNEHQGDSYA